ncbi:MAG: ArnT family glycosyltransferase [Bacteroidia bacterium]
MTLGKKQLTFCILILCLAKILFLMIARPGMEFYEDNDIAVNLSNTGEFFLFWDGIKNHTFQFPVYPSLLALCYSLFGITPLVAGILHVLLHTLTAFLLVGVFHFFLRLFKLPSNSAGYADHIVFISVILFCLHPGIAWYALFKIHPFSMDMLMLITPIWFTARYQLSPDRKNLLFFFLSVAIAVLTRATLVISILPFLILQVRKKGWLRMLIMLSALTVFIFLCCLPWMIRNYKQDHIIGLSSLGGKDIWKGSLPGTEGSNYLENGKDCYSLLSPGAQDSIQHMSVKEQNTYFMSLYFRNIRERPMLQCRLFLLKIKNFWLFRSYLGNEYGAGARRLIPFYLGFYLLVLGLAVLAAQKIGRMSLILFCVPILLSLEQSLYYVETRHRMITEPLLLFMAVIGIFMFIFSPSQTRDK